ncbi:MAG: preprotein translocase subunit SecG [Chloroflexota bacterium]|nr:MAG: preprotein translocase subunit SecG [Chloroflexota bacterium]
MTPYLQTVQIIVSIFLIVLVMMQSRGSGLTASSREQTSLFRTRRGIERTLFNSTLVLAVVWVLVSIATVFFHESAI